MVFVHFTSAQFLQLGLELLGYSIERQQRNQDKYKQQWFRSSFVCSASICSLIFSDLQTTTIAEARIDNPDPKFFLLAVYWLASYDAESKLAGKFGPTEKTVRNLIWKYTAAIQALKSTKIVWPTNLQQIDNHFVLTVDTIHCPIQEPRTDPDARWKSPKKGVGTGLSYELGISILEPQLIWISPGYKAATKDHDIFCMPNGLKSRIPDGKFGIADRGYSRDLSVARVALSIRNRLDTSEVKAFKNRVRARHENFNGRLKEFNILSEPFRSHHSKHVIVFEAVCVIVQYDVEESRPLIGG